MSKFDGIRRAKAQEPDPLGSYSRTQKSDSPEIQQAALAGTQKRKGRPRGKRSDPGFRQVTAYLPKDLYRRVKLKLLEAGEQDFSELIADLLAAWLGDP